MKKCKIRHCLVLLLANVLIFSDLYSLLPPKDTKPSPKLTRTRGSDLTTTIPNMMQKPKHEDMDSKNFKANHVRNYYT